MLNCVPQSLCSWDFYVEGASLGPAQITFNFILEQGSISIGSSKLSIQKQGWLSGQWSLEEQGRILAEAEKPSAFFRAFRIRRGDLDLALEAQSAFTRSFHLLRAGLVVGEIRPAHAFTRRAFIECDASVPETMQLFSFWLVLLMWRRAARNNSSGSS